MYVILIFCFEDWRLACSGIFKPYEDAEIKLISLYSINYSTDKIKIMRLTEVEND